MVCLARSLYFSVFNMRCYCCYYYCRAYFLLLFSSLHRSVLVCVRRAGYMFYICTQCGTVVNREGKKEEENRLIYSSSMPKICIRLLCNEKPSSLELFFTLYYSYRPPNTHFQCIFFLICHSDSLVCSFFEQYAHNQD